ncbi:hypothetical protein C8R43DRAFT_1133843 [Mycena crocata]|nr:hypothetical protein C8R43DRAFT_1133843 [Mycena crocata]
MFALSPRPVSALLFVKEEEERQIDGGSATPLINEKATIYKEDHDWTPTHTCRLLAVRYIDLILTSQWPCLCCSLSQHNESPVPRRNLPLHLLHSAQPESIRKATPAACPHYHHHSPTPNSLRKPANLTYIQPTVHTPSTP